MSEATSGVRPSAQSRISLRAHAGYSQAQTIALPRRRRVVDGAEEREQRAVERGCDAVARAGGDDGAGERLDFKRAAGQAVEIHRGAKLARIARERGEPPFGLVGGDARAVRAGDRDRFVEDGAAKL